MVAVYWGLFDGYQVGVMVYLGPVPGQFLLVVSVQEAMVCLCQ